MRLIDADALPRVELWMWECGDSVVAVKVESIDAAPTVSCEECRHGEWINTYAEDVVCQDCYGSQRFERRTT